MNDIATSGGAADFNLDDYMTDPVAELEGVWRELGKDKDGHKREIKLARANNEKYLEMLRPLQRKNQALLEMNDSEAFTLAEEIARECYAKHIIKGLRVDGKDVEYTPEKGREMLMKKDFFGKIKSMSEQMDMYKVDGPAVKS